MLNDYNILLKSTLFMVFEIETGTCNPFKGVRAIKVVT